MRGKLSVLVLATAVLFAALSLFGTQGVTKMHQLEQAVTSQAERNIALEQQVSGIKREILELKHNPRVLERVARGELGMARPNERIYIFEQDLESDNEQESHP